jgi:hypothetical protein
MVRALRANSQIYGETPAGARRPRAGVIRVLRAITREAPPHGRTERGLRSGQHLEGRVVETNRVFSSEAQRSPGCVEGLFGLARIAVPRGARDASDERRDLLDQAFDDVAARRRAGMSTRSRPPTGTTPVLAPFCSR